MRRRRSVSAKGRLSPRRDGHGGGQFPFRGQRARPGAGRRPLLSRCARPARPPPPFTNESASTPNLLQSTLHPPSCSLFLAPFVLAQGVFLGVPGLQPPLPMLVGGARRSQAASCHGTLALAAGGRRRPLPCSRASRLARPGFFGTLCTLGKGCRLASAL